MLEARHDMSQRKQVQVIKLADIRVDGLPKSPTCECYVELNILEQTIRTNPVRRWGSNSESVLWEGTHIFKESSASSTLRIQVYDRRVWSTEYVVVGEFREDVETLLKQCDKVVTRELGPPGSLSDIVPSRISFRLSSSLLDEVLDANPPTSVDVASTLDGGTTKYIEESMRALSAIEPVPSAFSRLVNTFGNFVQAVSCLAEVHPYAKTAWTVITFVFRVLESQATRDENIIDLVRTMSDMYDFITDAQHVSRYQTQAKILVTMVKQTEECAHFIQDYAKPKKFVTRATKNAFGLADERLKLYQNKFRCLREDFQANAVLETEIIVTQTEIVVTRILDTALDTSMEVDLNDLAYARGARYPETGCLLGTREHILTEIQAVLNGTAQDSRQILLLTGVAGSGKSAIASTIAKWYYERGRLVSSFFFSRSNDNKNRVDNVFTTIARDIADRNPAFRAKLWSAIKDNRSLRCTTNVRDQFIRFILDPAKNLTIFGPLIVVVDAVDECGDPTSRELFLKVLIEELSNLPANIRIFFTSRPDNDIVQEGLCQLPFVKHMKMEDIDSASSKADISAIIESDLIKFNTRLPRGWLDRLSEKAGNSFIWASTACRFVKAVGKGAVNHTEKLELVLSHPRRELEGLYLTVLRNAFLENDNENDTRVVGRFNTVMGAILGVKVPLSEVTLVDLLSSDDDHAIEETKSVFRCVVPFLGSLLAGTTRETEPLQPLHLSLTEFLVDSSRSQPFSIDIKEQNCRLAVACIDLMNQYLGRNICEIDDIFSPNPSFEEVERRMIRSEIRFEALRYACGHWVDHLIHLDTCEESLRSKISNFLTSNALHWIEVLSLTKQLESGVGSLKKLECWLQTRLPHATEAFPLEMIRDLQRFLVAFGDLLGDYALQAYSSALIFLPQATTLFTHYSAIRESLCTVKNPRKAWPPLITTLESHIPSATSLAFSPGGDRLVCCCQDGTLWLWNANNVSIIAGPMAGHTDSVTSIAFTPDSHNRRLASCSLDGTVRFWNADTGTTIGDPIDVIGNNSSAKFVIVSPDCQRIASCTCTESNTAKLWDTSTARRIGIPTINHTGSITCIVFSPDSHRLASCSEDRTVRLWSANDASAIGQVMAGHSDIVTAIIFSPDGALLASSSRDCTLRLWDAQNCQAVGNVMVGHSDQVNAMAFSGWPDNRRLSTWSSDETVRVWDVETGETFKQATVGSVNTVVFSPEGEHFASGSSGEIIRLWDAKTAKVIGDPLIDHTGPVDYIVFSPDGSRFVSWARDETIKLWDVRATHDFGENIVGHTDGVYSFTYSPDFRYIVSLSFDNTARLWRADTIDSIGEPLTGHTQLILFITFSPDGNCLATCSEDKTMRLWDIQTATPIGKPLEGHADAIYSVIFSSDSNLLASCSEDKTVKIWNAKNGGECISTMEGHSGGVYCITFSPNSTCLASCSTDKTVRFWVVHTGKSIGNALIGHTEPINSIVFSPDGSRLASCSFDGSVRLWDTRTLEIGQCMKGHEGSVYALLFSPDGTRLASCSDDKTVQLWDVEKRTPINGARIRHSTWVDSMTFSADSRSLTSYASGEARSWKLNGEGSERGNDRPSIMPVELRDEWLWVNEQLTLWIPLEYRGGAVRTMMKDGRVIVCIGCDTGSVVYVLLPNDSE